MKTIAFLNNKGGIGKTASVTTISHMLAKLHHKRVLVIDLDPQGNTSSLYSEVDFIQLFLETWNGTAKKTGYSVEDLLLDTNLDIHNCIQHTDYEGLDIIPSFLTLSEAEERLKADVKTPQQFRLKMQLDKVQGEYDYCLLDCSPSINIININGLVAADEVYIPTRCDGGSLIGIAITMNLIKTVQTYNPRLEVGGCFFTQYGGRKNVEKTVYDLLREIFPEGKLLPITIGVSKYLEENGYEQKPLLEMDTGKEKNKVTKSYMALTEYILAPNKKEFLKNWEGKG